MATPTQDDPESLQQAVRHAVTLAREKRWPEAGVLLRRCVRLGAFPKCPAERPVLIGVFARELYAPSMLAMMLGEGEVKLEATKEGEQAEQAAQLARAIAVAREEAAALAHAYRVLRGGGASTPSAATSDADRELSLGLCAWEAGDAELAFKHLDAADTLNDGDVSTNYLLMLSAVATCSKELASIKSFARSTALTVLQPPGDSEPASDRDQLYAVLTLMRLGEHADVVAATMNRTHAAGSLLEMLARVESARATATPDRAGQFIVVRPSGPVQGGFGTQLGAWAAWREIHRSVGIPPWIVAEAFKLGVTRRPPA